MSVISRISSSDEGFVEKFEQTFLEGNSENITEGIKGKVSSIVSEDSNISTKENLCITIGKLYQKVISRVNKTDSETSYFYFLLKIRILGISIISLYSEKGEQTAEFDILFKSYKEICLFIRFCYDETVKQLEFETFQFENTQKGDISQWIATVFEPIYAEEIKDIVMRA